MHISNGREGSTGSPWVLPHIPVEAVQPELSPNLASMQVYGNEALPRKSSDTVNTASTASVAMYQSSSSSSISSKKPSGS